MHHLVYCCNLKQFFSIHHDDEITAVIYAIAASKWMQPREEVSHPVAASWSHISSRYTTDCLPADYSPPPTSPAAMSQAATASFSALPRVNSTRY